MTLCNIPRYCEKCGTYITEKDIVSYKCSPNCTCDFCDFNLTERCPVCGTFLHCGGCI